VQAAAGQVQRVRSQLIMLMLLLVRVVLVLLLSLHGEMRLQLVKMLAALGGMRAAAGVVHIVLVLAVLVVTVVVATALVVMVVVGNQVCKLAMQIQAVAVAVSMILLAHLKSALTAAPEL
jgi:hypothetical protein